MHTRWDWDGSCNHSTERRGKMVLFPGHTAHRWQGWTGTQVVWVKSLSNFTSHWSPWSFYSSAMERVHHRTSFQEWQEHPLEAWPSERNILSFSFCMMLPRAVHTPATDPSPWNTPSSLITLILPPSLLHFHSRDILPPNTLHLPFEVVPAPSNHVWYQASSSAAVCDIQWALLWRGLYSLSSIPAEPDKNVAFESCNYLSPRLQLFSCRHLCPAFLRAQQAQGLRTTEQQFKSVGKSSALKPLLFGCWLKKHWFFFCPCSCFLLHT